MNWKCEICEEKKIKYQVLDIESEINSGQLSLTEIIKLTTKNENTSLVCDDCLSCQKKEQAEETSSGEKENCVSEKHPEETKTTTTDQEVQTEEQKGGIQKFLAKRKKEGCTEQLIAVEVGDGVLIVAPESKLVHVEAFKFFQQKFIEILNERGENSNIKNPPVVNLIPFPSLVEENPAKQENNISAQENQANNGDDDEIMFVSEEIKVKEEPMSPTEVDWINDSFVRVKSPNKTISHQCSICLKKFLDIFAVQIHIRKEHPRPASIRKTFVPANIRIFTKFNIEKCINGTFNCKICKATFPTCIKAKDHVVREHLGKRNNEFDHTGLKSMLITKCHVGVRKYRCVICLDQGKSLECNSRNEMMNHLQVKIHDMSIIKKYAFAKKKPATEEEKV